MDRFKLIEAKLEELDNKITKLSQNDLDESIFLDLFLNIENCKTFEDLQVVSNNIGQMRLPKQETLIFALAARIRQNTIVTEALDEAIYQLQKQFIVTDSSTMMH